MRIPQKNKIIYFLTGFVFLVSVLSTLNLSIDEKITAMLPDSDPMARDFKFIMDNMPETEIVYIDLQSLEKDQTVLEKAGDDFYNGISRSSFFTEIVYQFSHEAYKNLMVLVRENRALLLDQKDILQLETLLQPERIRARVKEIKRRFLDPAGMFTTDMLTSDPLGIDALILAKLEPFRNEARGVKIQGSRMISKDSDHLLIMAAPCFPAVDTDKSLSMMAYLHEEKERIEKKYNHDIRIRFSGNHVATLDNSKTIQQDVKRTVSVLSIGILVIGMLFFKRKRHVALIFVPTLVSLSFASAVVSFFYEHISAVALGCGAVLIGITVDFGIHVLFGIDAERNRSFKAVIEDLKRPILAGACTTMAAFSCLAFSSLPGQRQMGVFAVIGIGSAALFSVFLLRYFIPRAEKRVKTPLINLISICDQFMVIRRKHIRLICGAGILAVVVGTIGIQGFQFEGDVTKLNHLQSETKADMESFLETWGGTSLSLALVRADSLDRALEKNDTLYEILKDQQDDGILEKIVTLSHIFPSSKKRGRNHTLFSNMMTREKVLEVQRLFEKTALESGFRPAVFQPFFDSLLPKPSSTVTLEMFDNTVLKKLIESKIIFHKKEVFIVTSLQVRDKKQLPVIIRQIKSAMPDTMFLDKKYFVSNVSGIVAREFKRLLVFAAAAMVLVVMVFFKNLKVALIVISPVFCAAYITAGILGLLGIPINLISMIFIIFVFGVGVDFSIFLSNHELNKSKNAANVTAAAVVVCAMTTVGAFICLVFARHEALFSIGVAGLTGMVSSLVLSLIMIPTLMETFVRQGKDKGRFNE